MSDVLDRTAAALRAAVGRRDALLVIVGGGVGYLLVYLLAAGDLVYTGDPSASLLVADRPLQRVFSPIGYLSFEPIARIEAAGFAYLFSPVDASMALGLAALVGANLGLTYLGLVQPRACGLEGASGVVAAVPALLSGAACCGPIVLVVLGIQATSALLTGFQVLVPLAFLMLVGSLLLVGRRIDPSLLPA
ncbi:MAG: hypothetical protein ABEI39_06400 [Halobacteriales archaeon]